MSETVIEFKNVSKEYYNYKNNIQRILGIAFDRKPQSITHALKDVSFKIEKGERVCIFGVNGSGVTTAIKSIAGITYPTKGKVITKGKLNCYFNRRVGYEYELPSMDNIFMKANAIGLDKEIVKENLDYLIDFAEIGNHLKMPMKNAPNGAVVRLALALHFLVDSDIFVLDENLNLGGPSSKQKCQNLLKQYLKEHEDVTFVTSNIDGPYVKTICERGIVLHQGEMIFDGSSADAFALFADYYKKLKNAEQIKE